MKEIISLKLNDIVSFKNRLFKVCLRNWNNGKDTGKRLYLKLLSNKEMSKALLNNGVLK